jgi:group I intron endonuclease
MYIYLIVNHVTGKYYIGQHKGRNLKQYLQQKFYEAKNHLGGSSYLYASIRKHGREAFSIHALLSDVQTKLELDQHEKNFIEFLQSRNPEFGYNICKGGEGFTGKHSSTARQKISAASKAMWRKPEIRDVISKKAIGRKQSHEFCIALGERRRGKKASLETVQKLRDSHTGLSRTEESKIKQGHSTSGNRNHFYGKSHLDTTRLKICEARHLNQYHSACSIHGRLPISSPRQKCSMCKN